MRKKPKKGIILFHPAFNWRFVSFDIFVHKSYAKRYKKFCENLTEKLYYVDECEYVQKFLKENKDYIYLGSEDLCHDWANNVGNVLLIADLIKRGFKTINMSLQFIQRRK